MIGKKIKIQSHYFLFIYIPFVFLKYLNKLCSWYVLPAAPRIVSNTRPIILTFNLPLTRLDKKYLSLAAFISWFLFTCARPLSIMLQKSTYPPLLAQPLTSKLFLSHVCFWPCELFGVLAVFAGNESFIIYHQTIICILFETTDDIFLTSLAHSLAVAGGQYSEHKQVLNLWRPWFMAVSEVHRWHKHRVCAAKDRSGQT